MAGKAVRRLGVAPCTVGQINNLRKREALVAAKDVEGLKRFDEALAKKKKEKEAAKKDAATGGNE